MEHNEYKKTQDLEVSQQSAPKHDTVDYSAFEDPGTDNICISCE